jgi:hypothetical protein
MSMAAQRRGRRERRRVRGLAREAARRHADGGNAESGKRSTRVREPWRQRQGNQALNAPPLAGASDWYQLTALQKFKAGVRGTNPKDTTGMLMRPMSMTLADEQAMKDVIAYIATLNPAH